MKIDKIYVINLEHRKDRKKEIMEELSKMKVDDLGKVEIFRGIVPNEEMESKFCEAFTRLGKKTEFK
jgi:hypothetical protein